VVLVTYSLMIFICRVWRDKTAVSTSVNADVLRMKMLQIRLPFRLTEVNLILKYCSVVVV